MDIAFVTSGYPPISPGGAGISSQLIVQGLRKENVNVDVFALINDGDTLTQVSDHEYHLPKGDNYRVPKAIGENISAYSHLPSLDEYDLIHVYNVRHLPACVLRSTSPVVATFNNHMWSCIEPVTHLREGLPPITLSRNLRYAKNKGYPGARRIPRVMLHYVGKKLSQQADSITVQTEGMKQTLGRCGYTKEEITVVPNLLDPSFDVSPDNKKKIIFVGRLRKSKGPQAIVRAFKSLPEKLKSAWELELYGNGPLKSEIENMISNSGSDRISLNYCPYNKLPEVYRSAGLFVHTSMYTEPFSRCWLEAMASGTPLLCSKNPSSVSTLQGIAQFYDPFDIEDLSQSLEKCLSNPQLRAQMASQGKVAVESFRSDKVTKAYIDVYSQLT